MEVLNLDEVKKSSNVTVVTSTMEVHGTVYSKDPIEVDGKVFGNVTTTQSFTSSNLTVGTVTAEDLKLETGRVKGNIKTTGKVSLSENSVIVGNIDCGSISLNGKVKGNINVKVDAFVDKDALIVGDLAAQTIKTEQGARVSGKVITKSEEKPINIETEFDLGGDF